ncbi:MAG: hypothetical protein QHJ81_12365 [Anaerolineae bacterium]|nr:hypothetical protein [Anaerolineae bacterium]
MPTHLLDKNVARRIVEGLTHPDRLADEEAVALALWRALQGLGNRMFISLETANIMGRFSAWREIRLFLDTVETMYASRYFRRWARRLQEHGFTREDAKVLGLATYGTDAVSQMLGVEVVVTFDQSFINNYQRQRHALERRLRFMTAQLPVPFREAGLPEVIQPIEALLLFGRGLRVH